MLALLLVCVLFQAFPSNFGCMSMTPSPRTSLPRSNGQSPTVKVPDHGQPSQRSEKEFNWEEDTAIPPAEKDGSHPIVFAFTREPDTSGSPTFTERPQSPAYSSAQNSDSLDPPSPRSKTTETPSTLHPNTADPLVGSGESQTPYISSSPNVDTSKSPVQRKETQPLARLTSTADASESSVHNDGPQAPTRSTTWIPKERPRTRKQEFQNSDEALPVPLSRTDERLASAKTFHIHPLDPVEILSHWTLTEHLTNSTQELNGFEEASGRGSPIMERTEIISVQDNRSTAEIVSEQDIEEQQNICGLCPALFMAEMGADPTDGHFCSNWKSIQKSFNIVVSPVLPTIHDQGNTAECTRIITCDEPYIIVRWHNSSICDMHSLSYHLNNLASSFSYKCNGRLWHMRNFPIHSVACADKISP